MNRNLFACAHVRRAIIMIMIIIISIMMMVIGMSTDRRQSDERARESSA